MAADPLPSMHWRAIHRRFRKTLPSSPSGYGSSRRMPVYERGNGIELCAQPPWLAIAPPALNSFSANCPRCRRPITSTIWRLRRRVHGCGGRDRWLAGSTCAGQLALEYDADRSSSSGFWQRQDLMSHPSEAKLQSYGGDGLHDAGVTAAGWHPASTTSARCTSGMPSRSIVIAASGWWSAHGSSDFGR